MRSEPSYAVWRNQSASNPFAELCDFAFHTLNACAEVAVEIQGSDLGEVGPQEVIEVALEILIVAVARQLHYWAVEQILDVHG